MTNSIVFRQLIKPKTNGVHAIVQFTMITTTKVSKIAACDMAGKITLSLVLAGPQMHKAMAIIQVTTQVVTETKTKTVFSVLESPKLPVTFSNLAN